MSPIPRSQFALGSLKEGFQLENPGTFGLNEKKTQQTQSFFKKAEDV